jgi:hypothetical protein
MQVSEESLSEHVNEVERIRAQLEEEMRARMETERHRLEEEKERALRAQADVLARKAKHEVEGLRSRFKMMQTASVLERSPSTSESELPIEVKEIPPLLHWCFRRRNISPNIPGSTRASRNLRNPFPLKECHLYAQVLLRRPASKSAVKVSGGESSSKTTVFLI